MAAGGLLDRSLTPAPARQGGFTFTEGIRARDPAALCPLCGANSVYLAADFRFKGPQSIRVCIECRGVSLNGRRFADLEVHLVPSETVTP